MAEIQGGNLYEINKSLVAQTEKKLRGKALSNKIESIVIPYHDKHIDYHNYFMLLCHDRRDYTLFHMHVNNSDTFIEELKECLNNRGDILAIDNTEDKVALEIWMRIDEEIYCYYFFPYDDGVVEIE